MQTSSQLFSNKLITVFCDGRTVEHPPKRYNWNYGHTGKCGKCGNWTILKSFNSVGQQVMRWMGTVVFSSLQHRELGVSLFSKYRLKERGLKLHLCFCVMLCNYTVRLLKNTTTHRGYGAHGDHNNCDWLLTIALKFPFPGETVMSEDDVKQVEKRENYLLT